MSDRRPVLERLYAKRFVADSGCWLWTGHVARNGYAQIRMDGKRVLVHRASVSLHREPPGDNFVLHRCDVRHCFNPDHLFLGTQADNIRDAMEKGHRAYGERNGRAKLTDGDVRAIRAALAAGATVKGLAQQFGVGSSAIYEIKHGRQWRHM